jgi:type I restriction enzyme S subunit
VVFRDLQYVDPSEGDVRAFRLHDGDLLFNRTNSFELVGRTALFGGDREAVFASYLIRLQVDAEMLVPGFLNYYLNLDGVQQAIKSLATRGVSQSNISASKLRTFLVPKPALSEQRKITRAIETIASSLEACERRRRVRDELFQSALQQLMTGQLRVTPLLDREEVTDA